MSVNYKDTLIMPSTKMDMKANLNTKEPSIQKFWFENNIYEKVLTKNKKSKQFILHDGPPYANGNLHVGHSLNKILKDIIVRYKNMNGFYSEFIPGWDTHGLPIENAIKKIDKSYENNVYSAVEKRERCKEFALEQVEIQKKQFLSLGMLSDFKKKYLTLDSQFEINELNLFNEMIRQKIVYQDFKPVYWSWSSISSLADAEIEYYDVRSPSIYVSFNVTDSNGLFNEDVDLIIWTTTPWTIYSNLAIAVNPNFKYCLVKTDKRNFIISKNLVESVMKAIKVEKFKIIKEFDGKQLELIKYKHPLLEKINPVILADYVSDENGTGLVHNAPGFGLDDYYACKKYDINIYCPINDLGCFSKEINDDELEGVFYLDANKIIGERLDKVNALLSLSFITHSAAHDWRTKQPVMYRATKQWFVNTKILHKDIIKTLDKDVKSSNPKTIERIKEMILKRDEWCISRQRVWGLPIPIIFDENKNPIFDEELISNTIDIIKKEGTNIWFEKDPQYFLTSKYDKKKIYFKEKDTLDVWFDSGSTYNVLKDNKLNFPADIYLEGSDQFRGWFNSSLICSTISNKISPYKFLLQHGFVLDEKGRKMSKSIGNVIDPLKITQEYGADILRIWVASSDYSVDLRIGDVIIKQASETYRKIRNTLFRYSLSNLNNFNNTKNIITDFSIEDNYILYLLDKNIKKINIAYDNYKFLDIIKIVNNFTIELSQWYFDIIKDHLYCNKENDIRRIQIQNVLYIILNTLLILLTPIIPHTCEEVYQLFDKKDKKESIVLEDWIYEINYQLSNDQIDNFEKFFKIKNDVYLILEKIRTEGIIKKNNEATVAMPKVILDSINFDLKQLKEWLNVAKVVSTNKLEISAYKELTNKCLRCWNFFEDLEMHDTEICIRCCKNI